MEAIITKQNCKQELIRRRDDGGDIEGKAAAWSVVYDFLSQNGLKEFRRTLNDDELNMSGIERVISFLETQLKDK